MGNSPSTSGELLTGEASIRGHGDNINSPPNVQGAGQLAVWNPFDRSTSRDNYPDVQQALHYDPYAPSDSGPSIDELSRLHPDDFMQHQPPPSSDSSEERHQVELDAWFQRRAATRVSWRALHACPRLGTQLCAGSSRLAQQAASTMLCLRQCVCSLTAPLRAVPGPCQGYPT